MSNMPNVSKRNIVFLILVLATVVAGVLVWSWKFRTKYDPTDRASSSSQLVKVNSLGSIKIPGILSETAIPPDALPKEVTALFTDQAKNLLSESVVYETGSTGFLIELTLPTISVHDSYKSLTTRSKADWKILFGGRVDKAAVLDIENNTYQVKVEFVESKDIDTAVKIIIIRR